MAYRIDDLVIPPDDPFKNDALDRGPLVEFLADLIGRLNGPFVMALDSPWGTGKTTLVRMLEATLKSQNFQCIHFNAWKVDYVTDPLVALVSSLDRISSDADSAADGYKKHLKTVKKITSLVAKRGLRAATKALTVGVLDIDAEVKAAASEFATDAVGDIVDAFNQERELLEKFRTELSEAIRQLPQTGNQPNLIFFIDELDRCRPTFAIELLERVKHLFDIPNIVFVLSIDKQQLEASTTAVYGSSFNAAEYLRRFIDLEYGIPLEKSERYTSTLITRFGLDPAFSIRKNSGASYDRGNFIECFTLLANSMALSLRARERCIARLQVVMDQTPPDGNLDPILIATFIVLRSNQPELFARFITRQAPPFEVMNFFESLSLFKSSKNIRERALIHAHLLFADPDRERSDRSISQLGNSWTNTSLPEEKRNYDKELLDLITRMRQTTRSMHNLAQVATKIDLAARIQE